MNDNLIVSLLRDEKDEGVYIAWGEHWIERCKGDPKLVLATIGAIGMALQALSAMIADETLAIPKGLAN